MKKIFIIGVLLMSVSMYSQSENSNDTVNEPEVKVFPNPATNVINVLGLENSTKAEIIISDIYGNVVLQHRWEIRNNALNIPIPTLSTGVYSINVTSYEQKVRAKFYKK